VTTIICTRTDWWHTKTL